MISFLHFHNYPGAFIKIWMFELMLLCQAVLWIRYYFFQFRLWIRIRSFCFSSVSGSRPYLAVFQINLLGTISCVYMLEMFVVMCLWKLLSFWQKVLDPTCSGSGSGSTTMVQWSLSTDFAVKLFNNT